jgi:aryl-alcohol dehydrogenase-like predicted oxidoreductase
MNKLGLGCVTFGREIDEASSFELMDEAYANEITLFDTAAVYGGGASEEIIGKWRIKNLDKSIQVATKIIPPFDDLTIKTNVAQSLRRLHIAQIDILYLHRWDEQLKNLETWLVFEELINSGEIKEIGVSNFNFEQLNYVIALLKQHSSLKISYLQNNHNLAVSDLTDKLIELCQRNEVKIVTFSPLGAGFLTGKHRQGIATGSRFDLMPAHQRIYFNDLSNKKLEKLLQVARFTGHEPALLAIAWAIHQPCTYQVLVGGRSVAQLHLAIAANHFSDEQTFKLLDTI